MLTEEQVARYSRQILLPGVGGRGQERLLASTVQLYGAGEALSLCATWLAGAGIGRLAVPEGVAPGPREALSLERNPDCEIIRGRVASPNVVAAIGELPPDRTVSPRLVTLCVWMNGAVAFSACFDGTHPCRECLQAMGAPGKVDSPLIALVLGTFSAAEILSALLTIREGAEATLTRLDLSSGGASSAFPSRPACTHCTTP